MHRSALVLFLAAVFTIGALPLLMVGVWLARRKHDATGDDAERSSAGLLRMILGAVAVLVLAAGTAVVLTRNPQPATAGHPHPGARIAVPSRLAGMPLVDQVQGVEAIAAVSELHGQAIDVTGAAVATYGGADGSLFLWVATTADPAGAADLTERMRVGIADGSSPFSPAAELTAAPGIWRTTGMGQEHYFWADTASATVWWLSAAPAVAGTALAELLGGNA